VALAQRFWQIVTIDWAKSASLR